MKIGLIFRLNLKFLMHHCWDNLCGDVTDTDKLEWHLIINAYGNMQNISRLNELKDLLRS